MAIDFSTEHGKRVLEQLENESVIWLTTVAKSGTPQPNPVWFQYVDGDVIVYTQVSAVRLKNIVENDRVSLNFDSKIDGDGITVFTGSAFVDDSFPKANENPAYLEKYGRGIEQLDSTPEEFAAEYPVVMRIRPGKLRGW